MISFKSNRTLLVIVSIIICILSCGKTNPNVIEIPSFRGGQKILEQLIDSRVQVYDVNVADGWFSLKLRDSVIKINSETLPFLYLNENGKWIVNDETLPVKIETIDSFPKLAISKDGYLIVEGFKSHFSWTPSSRKHISSGIGWIWAVAQLGSYLCFYRSEINNVIIPVANNSNYIIPDYYFDLVVEKERECESAIERAPTDQQLGYIFFTDAHWGRNQKHSPAIIKHIIDYTPIEQVLFGGDVNTSYTETVEGTLDIGNQFQNAFNFLGPHLYCLFGNHDDNTTGQITATERHLTEEQVYAYLQSQMTDVVFGDYYNFYYDDVISKTRVICLDTGRYYNQSFLSNLPNTAKFVVDVLSSTPEGWHIVVASHIWTSLISFETGEQKESAVIRPIIAILENYNMRAKSSFSYGGMTIDYDYSNAGAIVEYCIGGHTHADGVVYSKEGLPLIISACDGQQEVAGGVPFTTGTINEQCITIVVNDYHEKIVHMYRIGRGVDRDVDMWHEE